MFKLSILVCTIPERLGYLERLKRNLAAQMTKDVELLINDSNGSIGKKRNQLLEEAQGKYVCFIDDDDLVAPNYVELILNELVGDPDVIGMNLIMTTNGKKAERSYHSLCFEEWSEIPDPLRMEPGKKVYFRNPNHLNPVKRELALKVKFPEINHGEDRIYSMELLQHLKTENYIDQPLYYYLFRPNK